MIRILLFFCVAMVAVSTVLVEAPQAQAAYGDWVVKTNTGKSYACSSMGDAMSLTHYLRDLGFSTTTYYKGQLFVLFNVKVWRYFGRAGWSLIVDETGSPNSINQIYNRYHGMGSQYRTQLTKIL